MRFIGVALGPPVVSLLMSWGHWQVFGTMAGLGAVGGLLTLFAVHPSEEKKAGSLKDTGLAGPGRQLLFKQRAR